MTDDKIKEIHMSTEVRQAVELAMACGRALQSPQTGFVHYYPLIEDEQRHDTIPIVENFLFALSLLRSCTVANVTEAKEMLRRLLCFQNVAEGTSKGNFPLFLHDYPQCKDRAVSTHLLPIFYWILRSFMHVLGEELRDSLHKAAITLAQHALGTHAFKPLPYPVAVKLGAAVKSLGVLCEKPEWTSLGENILIPLCSEDWITEWASPQDCGEMLIAMQLDPQNNVWKPFWKYIQCTWHWESHTYVGPASTEWFERGEPQLTTYDIFLGVFVKDFSYRCYQFHPMQLWGALVHESAESFSPIATPFDVQYQLETHSAYIKQHEKWGFSVMQGSGENPQKGKSLLNLVWGSSTRTYTMVCPDGKTPMDYEIVENGVDLLFTLPEGYAESPGAERELVLAISQDEAMSFLVQGGKATTFQLGDKIEVIHRELKLNISFELEGGEGKFMGHIAPGNRPSQVSVSGKNRFAAFDWLIFLRTLERPAVCAIRVKIRQE